MLALTLLLCSIATILSRATGLPDEYRRADSQVIRDLANSSSSSPHPTPNGGGLDRQQVCPSGTASSPSGSIISAPPGSTPSCYTPDPGAPNWINNTESWTQLGCDTISDCNVSSYQHWQNAKASDALKSALAAYISRPKDNDVGNMNFTEFFWSTFGATTAFSGGVDCAIVGPDGCGTATTQVQCGTGSTQETTMVGTPAAVLIINAMRGLNLLMYSQQQGMNTVFPTFKGSYLPDIVQNYAPQYHDDDDSQEKLDFALQILGDVMDMIPFGSIAGQFAKLSSGLAEGVEALESLEKATNVLSTGMGLIDEVKSEVATPSSTPAPSELTDLIGDKLSLQATQYQKQLQSFMDTIMVPTDDTISQQLEAVLNDGFFNNDTLTKLTSNTVISDPIQNFLLGQSIQVAWSLAKPDGYIGQTIVLRIDPAQIDCSLSYDQWPKNLTEREIWIDPDVVKKCKWCGPDGATYLLTHVPKRNCNNVDPICENFRYFQVPPGFDNLGGSPYNINWIDIVKSAYGGFLANGSMNGYSMPFNSSLRINDNLTLSENGVIPIPGLDGPKTPGFWNLTVCLDPIQVFNNAVDGGDPCPSHPDPGYGAKDFPYNPGWCTMRIQQWQPNLNDTNPSEFYQVSVMVFDSLGLQIGGIDKQPMDKDGAMMMDSELPYHLVVSAPGVQDWEPIQFWYSDQYWDTNSTEHQCTWYAVDGGTGQNNAWETQGAMNGTRTGACGFSCPVPQPGQAPPPSATPKLPGIVTMANDDTTKTWSNMYNLERPTPTPTGAYNSNPYGGSNGSPDSTGDMCEVFIYQYQPRQNAENPTDNYRLEVYLYGVGETSDEASANVAGASGLVEIFENAPLIVHGLEFPFQVISNSTFDTDPLDLQYLRPNKEVLDMNDKDKCHQSPGCENGKDWYGCGYRKIWCYFDC